MKTFWDQIAHQLKSPCTVSLHKKGKETWDVEATIKAALEHGLFFTVEPMPNGFYEICIKDK